MNRQDRQAARTPADLEYKYNFRKSFAQAMGIATDAQKQAKVAQSNTTALSGIVASLSERVDEIELIAKDIDADKIAELSVKVDAIDLSVKEGAEKIAELSVKVDSIDLAVKENGDRIAELSVKVDEIDLIVKALDEDKIAELSIKVDEILQTVADLDAEQIAQLSVRVSDNEASITSLTKWKSDVEGDVETIASIKQQADDNEASITSLTALQGETNTALAAIEQRVAKNEASIKSTVSVDDVTAEFLIGVINGESTAKISADRLDIVGKTLDINVNATNILGTLTLDTKNSNGDHYIEISSAKLSFSGAAGIYTKDLSINGASYPVARTYGDWEHNLNTDGNGWVFTNTRSKAIGQIRYRTVNGNYFEIATDYDHQNLAGMMLNAPTSRNNIIYGSWDFSDGEPSYGSDRNIKNSIADIPNEYSVLFDNLRPAIFKYNNGNSGRTHTGFIAQEVLEATENAGLTSMDFAGVCVRDEGTEYELWTIRSGEIVALCVNEIQKLKSRIAQLEQA